MIVTTTPNLFTERVNYTAFQDDKNRMLYE